MDIISGKIIKSLIGINLTQFFYKDQSTFKLLKTTVKSSFEETLDILGNE